MSSRREVFVRTLALLQRKTLIETKNRTLKCLKRHYSTVRSMKNVAVLTEDGAFSLFFRPIPGDLTAQESPPLRICHPRRKICYCPGVSPWTDALGRENSKGLTSHYNKNVYLRIKKRKHALLMVNSLRLLARFLLLFVNHMI